MATSSMEPLKWNSEADPALPMASMPVPVFKVPLAAIEPIFMPLT
jgi:hypothetical protein